MPQRLSWLAADQVTSSASNLIIVLVAARRLESVDFAAFATIQLLSMTFVGIGRVSIYGPSLSTQRTSGRARIPSRWVLYVAFILALVLLPITVWIAAANLADNHLMGVFIVGVAPLVVLVQDGFRHVRLAEGRFKRVFVSDLLWLMIGTGLVASVGDSLMSCLSSWALGGLVALLPLYALRTSDLPEVSAIAMRRLGLWGLLDSSLAAVVIAGPTVVSAVYMDSEVVTQYRVIQTAVSPMNIMSAVLLTRFGLDAWRLGQDDGLRTLDTQIKRMSRLLVAIGAVLLAVSVPLAIWFTQLDPTEMLFPIAVLCFWTAAGVWASPRQAASQALGMQRVSALMRVASATFAVLVTASVLLGYGPADPIGATIIGTTVLGIIGTKIGFSRGRIKLQREIAAQNPNRQSPIVT